VIFAAAEDLKTLLTYKEEKSLSYT